MPSAPPPTPTHRNTKAETAALTAVVLLGSLPTIRFTIEILANLLTHTNGPTF